MRTIERKDVQGHNFSKEAAELLDRQIEDVLREMHDIGVTHPDYPKYMAYVEKLHDLKAKSRREKVSLNTIVMAAAHLFGIGLILAYEQKHVLTTKAFTLLPRPK